MGKENQKHWWAPIWTGLVIDPESSHYKKMKNAIWLYLYLVLSADRKSGFLKRKIRTICLDMGVNRDMVLRWLKVLKEGDYITTVNTGRHLTIHIKKWKSVSGVGKMQLQKLGISDFRGWKNPTSQEGFKGPKTFYTSQNFTPAHTANDITIKRDINNDKRALAIYLADSLDDLQNLPLYIALSKRYPEQFLKEILDHVKAIPIDKIKKNRGALFNHLIKRNFQTN